MSYSKLSCDWELLLNEVHDLKVHRLHLLLEHVAVALSINTTLERAKVMLSSWYAGGCDCDGSVDGDGDVELDPFLFASSKVHLNVVHCPHDRFMFCCLLAFDTKSPFWQLLPFLLSSLISKETLHGNSVPWSIPSTRNSIAARVMFAPCDGVLINLCPVQNSKTQNWSHNEKAVCLIIS